MLTLTLNFLVAVVNTLNTKTHSSKEIAEFFFENVDVKSDCCCKQKMKSKLSLSSECVRDQSGWGFTVKQDGRTVHEDSGAHRVTTSSLTMEVEAVTQAIQWLASQHDAQITHAIILTDSMNLLQKVESGMGCPDWHTAMHCLRLQRLLWIYCPGHAGVSGNERADRLASTADITSGLQLGRAEVLRGLRNFLSTDKPEHHSIDRLKERGVEKGSGRHSTLQGRERSVFNQTNIGTVSRATLGRLLRDGAERVWAFPSATMPS